MDLNNLWSEYDLNSKKQNTRCLAVNTILEGKYLVGPVLGQGGFGITYVGYDLNMETKVAIKEYFPVELVSRDTMTMHGDRVLSLSGEKSVTYKAGLKKYVAEAQNVSQFSEIPGVVSVKDFFYANETAYIVMEFIDGISLKDYLKEKGGRLTEEETLKIMKPILEALVQVHKSGIIHRDISPDNIMLTFKDGNAHTRIESVKLIDFGAARMTAKNDQKSLTIILKHGYAPEEQYRTHGEQGPWTDVYALCAVLYRMLTGETPVPAMDRMFKDELKTLEQCGAKVSGNTSAAILKGLAVKKDDRIQSVQELIAALYEGKKVAVGKKIENKKNNSGKTVAVAGICAAVAAIVAGIMLVSRGKEENPANIPDMGTETVIAENTMAVETKAEKEETTIIPSEEASVLVDMESGEDELGPQIVWPRAETMVAGGFNHVVSLRDDGTVLAAGSNFRGQCEVSDWDNVAAVYAGESISMGLRTDGTVLTSGRMTRTTVSGADVSSWSGIVDLAVCNTHVLGLTEDGHVVSAGNGENGCCNTGKWENIKDIWVEDNLSFAVDGDGNLYVEGIMQGQDEVLEEVKGWKNVVDLDMYGGNGNGTIYAITADGKALCAGSQAGNNGEALAEWTDVVALEVGDGFIAGLKSDGTIMEGRRGVAQNEEIETWEGVCALASTMYEVIGIKEDGTVIMTKPSVTGNATLEEILEMNDLKDTAWTDKCLYVLNDEGNIKLIGYVEYWRSEGEEEGTWTGIESITSSSRGIAAITKDGILKLPEDHTYTFEYDETSELSREEQSDLAQEHVQQTPKLWESWTGVKEGAVSDKHVVAMLEDGSLRAAGFPGEQTPTGTDYKTGLTFTGTCDVNDWSEIKQIAVTDDLSIGLKEDGTLITAGTSDKELSGYSDLESIWYGGASLFAITNEGKALQLFGSDNYGQNNTASWDNLIQIAPGSQHTAGLKADGTVVAVGSNFCGQCDVEEWTDVVKISVGPSATVGLTKDGTILMAGTLPDDVWALTEWGPIDMTKVQID